MSVNTIVHLSLLNFLIYQNNAFALFHKIPSARKLCHHKLFSSSTTAHNYRAFSTDVDKVSDDVEQMLYQSIPTSAGTQKNILGSSGNLVKQVIEDQRSLILNDDDADISDFTSQLSKLNDFANEGDVIIQKLRKVAFSMKEASDDNLCSINDFDCAFHEENYHNALKTAREVDYTFGLGSDESLQAWATVDEVYLELESHNSSEEKNGKEEKKLEDILDACSKLEVAFRDLQSKIDRNNKKREL